MTIVGATLEAVITIMKVTKFCVSLLPKYRMIEFSCQNNVHISGMISTELLTYFSPADTAKFMSTNALHCNIRNNPKCT